MTSKMNYLATITYVTKFQGRPKMASKWPLRSILSSEQAQVASITYVANFHGTRVSRVSGAIKTDACIECYKNRRSGCRNGQWSKFGNQSSGL